MPATADPVIAAIAEHQTAVAGLEAAEHAYREALTEAQTGAIALTGSESAASRYWHYFPDDLGLHVSFGPGFIDVSDQAIPPGQSKCYSAGVWTHEGIDRLADAGALYRGEPERLHAQLDRNLRHRDAINRLAVAADEALGTERQASRDLLKTVPTTAAGVSAIVDYLRMDGLGV